MTTAKSTISGTLAVRQGLLLEIEPRPSMKKARFIGDLITKSHVAWAQECQSVILGVEKYGQDLSIEATGAVRQRWERDTRVIDLPRTRYHENGGGGFETRVCLAVCAGKQNSKLWARICSAESFAISNGNLRQLTSKFRSIVQALLDLYQRNIVSLLSEHNIRVNNKGTIEIVPLVSNDEFLRTHLENLENPGVLAALLKSPESSNRIAQYFGGISDTPFRIFDYAKKSDSNPFYWFTSSVPSVDKNGYIQQREVLYLMRALDQKAQALGIGFDESLDGKITIRSQAQVGTWIGEIV
jgi:hypothetical protein